LDDCVAAEVAFIAWLSAAFPCRSQQLVQIVDGHLPPPLELPLESLLLGKLKEELLLAELLEDELLLHEELLDEIPSELEEEELLDEIPLELEEEELLGDELLDEIPSELEEELLLEPDEEDAIYHCLN
jgi:hypothetical protein